MQNQNFIIITVILLVVSITLLISCTNSSDKGHSKNTTQQTKKKPDMGDLFKDEEMMKMIKGASKETRSIEQFASQKQSILGPNFKLISNQNGIAQVQYIHAINEGLSDEKIEFSINKSYLYLMICMFAETETKILDFEIKGAEYNENNKLVRVLPQFDKKKQLSKSSILEILKKTVGIQNYSDLYMENEAAATIGMSIKTPNKLFNELIETKQSVILDEISQLK